MVGIRGGLLAATAVIALGFARYDGGAAGLLEDEGGASGASGGEGGEGGQGGAGGDGGQGAGEGGQGGEGGAGGDGENGQVAEWMKSFSGEKGAEGALSHQEWLAKTGIKSLDHLVEISRENQKAAREKGIKIPGENATDAEKAAYREAIGVPKEAAGYEIVLPEHAKDYEIDAAFLEPMRQVAFDNNIPAAAFKALSDTFMKAQLENAIAEADANDTDAAAKLKEWGSEAPQRKEEFKRGAGILKLNKTDVAAIQSGFGAGKTLELLALVGQLAGEDFFAGSGDRRNFGVANADEAQKQIDAMIGDKEMGAKLRAKDPVAVARYNRLTDALAYFKEKAAKAA